MISHFVSKVHLIDKTSFSTPHFFRKSFHRKGLRTPNCLHDFKENEENLKVNNKY